jgi:hypothetical protein
LTAAPFNVPDKVAVPDVTAASMSVIASVRLDVLATNVTDVSRAATSPRDVIVKYGAWPVRAKAAFVCQEPSLWSCPLTVSVWPAAWPVMVPSGDRVDVICGGGGCLKTGIGTIGSGRLKTVFSGMLNSLV